MSTGISYGQRPHVCISSMATLMDDVTGKEFLRLIVVPSVELHHLTFQQDTAPLHFAWVCRDFLRQEGLPGCYIQTRHLWNTYGMFWIGVSACRFQFSRMATSFKWICWRNGTTSPVPQLTSWWCPCFASVTLCVRLKVDTCY